MPHFLSLKTLLLTAVLTGLALPVQAEDAVDFTPVAGFPQTPDHITWAACSGVAINSQGQVYIFHRGKHPLVCFDKDGKYIPSWGEKLDAEIATPHGLRIDSEDNIWLTDIGHHLVRKYSPKGKLLLAVGTTDKPGTGENQFDKPTDVAFGPQGEFFVTDGYGNSRVMVFGKQGKFLRTWGHAGTGEGEFNTPHVAVVDKAGRLLVGDRENNRIQVFSTDGKLQAIWTGMTPFGMALDRDGRLFIADGKAHNVVQLDKHGKIVGKWGKQGHAPGEFGLPHMLAIDADGNLYVTEITGMRVQKLARKK